MYVPRSEDRRANGFENIVVTPENLFLRKPLSEYRVVLVDVSGDISVVEIIEQVLKLAKSCEADITLILGPTSPFDSAAFKGFPIAWVASTDPRGKLGDNIELVDPHRFLDLSLFVDRESSDKTRPRIIIGDFLDCLFLANASMDESVFSFFNHLVSRVKIDRQTLVLIVSEKLHEERHIKMVRRFADVIIECRERQDNEGVIWETRGINFADRVQTAWIPGRRGSETAVEPTPLEDARLRQHKI